MSLSEWVLVGVAVWAAVAVLLGLVIARFLRTVGEQDETRSDEGESPTSPANGGHTESDDTVPEPRDGGHDEVEEARRRRRRSG